MRDAHGGRFGDDATPDRGRLELRRADALAGDVERVVTAPVQVPVAVRVDRRPVAVRPHAGEAAPVRLEVPLVVPPDAARHAGPRAPADELADLAAHRVALPVDDVHVLAERRKPERDGLDRLGDDRRQKARAHLGAAGDVHDRRAPAADVIEEPAIRIRVPRLAGRAQRLQRRQVGRRLTLRDERAHERRREAEHRDALGLDGLPQPVVGPVRCTLGEDDGRSGRAAAEHCPRAHDPAHVGGEMDAAAGPDVRLVRDLAGDRDEKAALDVQRSLRLAGRARRVREQIRRLRVDLEGREHARLPRHDVGPLAGLAVPGHDVLDREGPCLVECLSHLDALAAAQ